MQTVTQNSSAWPRRVSLASSKKKDLLERFQRDLDASERIAPMHYNYQRIDPYIIETEQAGHTYSLIIYNIKSALWYAQDNWKDHSFTHLHEHKFIQPGDVIFDIGCNAGFTSCWYALSTGPRGKVHALIHFPGTPSQLVTTQS